MLRKGKFKNKQTNYIKNADTGNKLIREFQASQAKAKKNPAEKKSTKRKFDDGDFVGGKKKQKTFSQPGQCSFFDKQQKRNNYNKEGKLNWTKVKTQQKRIKEERKKAGLGGSDVYEIVQNAKKIWEELRRDDCKPARKAILSKDLYEIIKGKVKSFIYSHDIVRVVQTLVNVGDEKYQMMLYLELKDEIVKMSMCPYSKFFVIKLLKNGTREQRSEIMQSFGGKVVKLMRHKIASDVVELAYSSYASAAQRCRMLQEFYGTDFKFLKDDNIKSLEDALKKNPTKNENILNYLQEKLYSITEKRLFFHTMVHTLLKELICNCDPSEYSQIIESMREHLLAIIHTRDGARFAMMCLWKGTAKDRKVILNTFKTYLTKVATEPQGHMVLLAAFDCIDDTIYLGSAILKEIMANIEVLKGDETGRKVLRYLVSPRDKVFFHPDVLNVLQKGDNNPNSKKDADIRIREIKTAIADPICEYIVTHMKEFVEDSHWTLFIGAAIKMLQKDEHLVKVYNSLVEIFAIPLVVGDENHFLEKAHITKMLNYVINLDKSRIEYSQQCFGPVFIEAVGGDCVSWTVTNRGCFLLVKLLETGVTETVDAIKQILQPSLPVISKRKFKGAEILCKKLK